MNIKFNVFEGTRRLVKVIMAIVLVIGIWFFIYPSYYPQVIIKLETNTKPMLVQACPSGSATGYGYGTEGAARGVGLKGCFVDFSKNPNDSLIRDKVMSDPWLPQTLHKEIKASVSAQKWSARESVLKFTGGALLSVYVLSVIMGWIVRGFFGIQRGKDSRQ